MRQFATGCAGADAKHAVAARGNRGSCLPGLLHRAVSRLHLLRHFWLSWFWRYVAGHTFGVSGIPLSAPLQL